MSKNILPHHAWAKKRKYMDFIKSKDIEAKIEEISNHYIERGFTGVDDLHILLNGNLHDAGYSMETLYQILGHKGINWEQTAIQRLCCFHILKGKDHYFPLSYTSPAAVLNGMALTAENIKDAPPAVFMSFEQQNNKIFKDEDGHHGGVMILKTTAPELNPDEEVINITIWPEDEEDIWPEEYSRGISISLIISQAEENLIENVEKQLDEMKQKIENAFKVSDPSFKYENKFQNYRDVFAIALNAYSSINTSKSYLEWQDGIPLYIAQQMEGENPEAAIKYALLQGYVKQIKHEPVSFEYDRNIVAIQKDNWHKAINEITEKLILDDVDVLDCRYGLLKSLVIILREATNNLGWLNDIWPEQREILINSENYGEILEKYDIVREKEAVIETEEEIAKKFEKYGQHISPLLVELMLGVNENDPGTMQGHHIQDVIGMIMGIQIILTDKQFKVNKDRAMGIIIHSIVYYEQYQQEIELGEAYIDEMFDDEDDEEPYSYENRTIH